MRLFGFWLWATPPWRDTLLRRLQCASFPCRAHGADLGDLLLALFSPRPASGASRGPKKVAILTEEHRNRLLGAIKKGYRQLKDFYTAECTRSERSAGAFLDLFEGGAVAGPVRCAAHTASKVRLTPFCFSFPLHATS